MLEKVHNKEDELTEAVRNILEKINNEDRAPGEPSILYEQLAEAMDKLIEFRMARSHRAVGGRLSG